MACSLCITLTIYVLSTFMVIINQELFLRLGFIWLWSIIWFGYWFTFFVYSWLFFNIFVYSFLSSQLLFDLVVGSLTLFTSSLTYYVFVNSLFLLHHMVVWFTYWPQWAWISVHIVSLDVYIPSNNVKVWSNASVYFNIDRYNFHFYTLPKIIWKNHFD